MNRTEKGWRLAVRSVLVVLVGLGLLSLSAAWAQEGADSADKAKKTSADAKAGAGEAKTKGSEDESSEGAATAESVEEDAVPRTPYVSPIAVICVTLVVMVWLGLIEWVTIDARKAKAKQDLWNSLLLIVGLVGMVLTFATSWLFSLMTLPAVIGVFTAYAIKRNQLVAPEERLFTRKHLAFLLAAALSKIGIKVSQQALAGDRQDEPEIELLRKDGQSLDALSAGSRAPGGASEAILAVKEIIESAVLSRVTDIHIEPKEQELQVRFRIDGILHNVPSYPKELAPPMISALKVLAEMDIAERRKPQDGGCMGRLADQEYDFRVATTPTVHGETMVIRILDRDQGLLRLDRLGVDQQRMDELRRIVNAPHGMMIVSGPTGSGKSTTLYACLLEIDAYQKNIMTIENPIEYRLDNITQTQINPKAGVTFSGQLRSLLRQDPDVIMVGEIRDAETARTALQAAMTGHFVLSTVHANDAVSTLYRLMDLGVEPYLISSSLTAVLAQRLVRVLCETCKQPYTPKPEFLKKVGLSPNRVHEFFRAEGCEECQGTGYYGRVGLFEILELNDAIRDLMRGRPSLQVLKAQGRKAGLVTLQEDGLKKVVQGVTSVKELIRVTK